MLFNNKHIFVTNNIPRHSVTFQNISNINSDENTILYFVMRKYGKQQDGEKERERNLEIKKSDGSSAT